jgi:hypothetical protein
MHPTWNASPSPSQEFLGVTQRHRTRLATPPQARLSVRRDTHGLLLELDEVRGGTRVRVIAAFTRAATFEEWCRDDPLRFESPMLHQQAVREAQSLWLSTS